MPVLVVQIPPRARLTARAEGADSAAAEPSARLEYSYALTDDGLTVAAQGRASAKALPNADAVVAVLSVADVSWHRVSVPKAPPTKLRAALGGLLEEALLDEPEALHFALAPDHKPAQPAWVAVVHKAWLEGVLAAFDKAGITVDRVVPSMWPGDAPRAHFFDAAAEDGSTPEPTLVMVDVNSITCVPLAGSLARALLPAFAAQPARWTATPAVAAPAERWLGAAVHVQTEVEQVIAAARSLWNLRQFDLASRHRGSRALLDLWKSWMSPGWRPARLGLAGLVVLQLVGLNLWAWAQRNHIDDKKRAQVALLQSVHPQERVVVDAPLQMQRATEALRAAAGRRSDTDLESMLSAAAAAWPDGQGAAPSLRFEPGSLTVPATGWSDEQVRQFRDRLRRDGWSVDLTQGRLLITRAAAATSAKGAG